MQLSLTFHRQCASLASKMCKYLEWIIGQKWLQKYLTVSCYEPFAAIIVIVYKIKLN